MIALVQTWTSRYDSPLSAGAGFWELSAWQVSSYQSVSSSIVAAPRWFATLPQTQPGKRHEPKSLWTVYYSYAKHKEDQHGIGNPHHQVSVDDIKPQLPCDRQHRQRFSLPLWSNSELQESSFLAFSFTQRRGIGLIWKVLYASLASGRQTGCYAFWSLLWGMEGNEE